YYHGAGPHGRPSGGTIPWPRPAATPAGGNPGGILPPGRFPPPGRSGILAGTAPRPPARRTDMNTPVKPTAPAAAPLELRHPPTPLLWRAVLLAVAAGVGAGSYFAREALGPSTGPRAQAGLGALCFLVLAAAFSTNLR